MKRVSRSVLGTLVFGAVFAAVVLAATRVAVTGGTPVAVHVDGSISSGTANVGDTFQLKADKDVTVNGWVVIKQGAGGQGTVTSVDHAGKHGKQGNLGIRFDYIFAVSGEKIQLSSSNKSQQGQGKQGASSTATVGSTILLGPIGLFAHNFVHGKDVTLDASRALTAYVDHTVHVVATAHAAGFAH
jgi:hypothetical protein